MGKLKGFLMAAAMAALLNVPAPVNACTLFAANGNVVDGGGTLVGKNRDAVPDNQFIQFNNKHQNDQCPDGCSQIRINALYADFGQNRSQRGENSHRQRRETKPVTEI